MNPPSDTFWQRSHESRSTMPDAITIRYAEDIIILICVHSTKKHLISPMIHIVRDIHI